MATKTSLYIIFVAVCLLHTTESRCVDVPVEYCRRLGFTGTYFPNHFYHRSISEAVAAFHQFIAADGECSDDFGKFVCAAYFPGCTLANNLRVDIRFNPCRKLCNSAFKPCKLSFKRLKIKWPPELRCGTFPTKECTSVMDELVPHIPMPPTPAPSDISCETISYMECQNLGYDKTTMPNRFGQTTQETAGVEVDHFKPLIGVQCSEALQTFVCASFFPPCSDTIAETPCRSLCEAAKDGCVQIMRSFGYEWPKHLRCSDLPNDTCFDGGFSSTNTSEQPSPAPVESQCEPLTIPLCQDLGYTSTMMPNMLGQNFQQDAQMTLQTFVPLLQTQCSPALKLFLCAAYAPSCSASSSQMPCRSLCEEARDGCLPTLETFGFGWPGPLNCSSLSNENCYNGGFSTEVQNPEASTMPTQVESQCEPLTISLCQDLGYTSTKMPNMFGQSFQQDAQMTLQTFVPLLQTQCSPALKPFLCAAYAPSCSASSSQMPCRSLCEAARDGCLPTLETFGFGWPGPLNCSFLSNENCYDGGFSTEVQNPDGSCEDIILPMCLNMSYSQTRLPNVLGHTSQFDALTAIIDNVILVGCSPTILPFLCSVYTPMCTADGSAKPCRSLCQQTMYECQQLLTLLNIKWPVELECSQFTDEDPSCMTDNATASTVPTTEVESQCEPLKIPLCQNLGYTSTVVPNYFGHSNQEYAALEVHQFFPLIEIECSPALQPFLCSLYAPNCPVAGSTPQMPCRTLCEMAKGGCSQIMDQYGFGWPESLKCSSLSNENCFDAGFSTEIQNPDGSCEDIILPMCLNMSYSQTRFPNVLGHTSQLDALTAIIDNVILVGCSPTMLPFLCSVYTPMCTADGSAKPCRSLCQQTMYECQQLLTALNLKWPEELECSNFTDDDPSCNVDDIDSENDTSILRCEPLRNPHCEGLSYDRTQIPNMLGDVDQDSAVLMMTSFAPMIATGCSPKLKALVCAVVSPPCSSGVQVQPCRSLCEAVERDCGSIFPNGTDAEMAFPCFLLPNQNCYDGKTTIGISPTVSSDEVEMYTDEIAIVGHEVDDRVAYGSNCEKIYSRRYDVTDLGLSEYFRGWVDVQGQGAANDYCRVVRGENGNLDLTCALAGTSGMSEFNYNITSLDGENFIPGRYGEWYIRDENGDGRDDYCRCVYRDFSLFVSCIPAMAEGFVGNEEFRVEAKGCGVEQFNPFIGPRP